MARFVLPFPIVVKADSDGSEDIGVKPRMIRPSELPIYESPQDLFDYEYQGHSKSSLEEALGTVRTEVNSVFGGAFAKTDKICNVYQTGKAHTLSTIQYIADPENSLARAGAIAAGGVLGVLVGAIRRGNFFKKLFYTSLGLAGVSSVCFPQEAKDISKIAYANGKQYGIIAYNFVIGEKPQNLMSSVSEKLSETIRFDKFSSKKSASEGVPSEGSKDPSEIQSESSESPSHAEDGTREGKDTGKITEGDHGQSNPEDKDMYTTRS